jgi:hypothetical protein
MVTATLLALSAAVLHATWNLILKVSEDRDAAFWAQWLIGAVLSVPVLSVVGLPDRAAWPYLIISAAVQVVYVTGLSRAYTHGDFSLAYPLARAAAPCWLRWVAPSSSAKTSPPWPGWGWPS